MLLTLNVMVQLQLHSAENPDLKPAVHSHCDHPLNRALPPRPRPHPCTARDPLHPEYSVLSNYFHRIPLRHRYAIQVAFGLCNASTAAKSNPERFRQQPTLKQSLMFRFSASFRCLLSFYTYTLSWFLADEAAATHSRFSCQQSGQQLWSVRELQVLACIRSSSVGQRCSSRRCGSCSQTP